KWPEIFPALKQAGITSILVEGGAEVFSRLLSEGAVDRLYLFVAPKLIGARSGLSWTKNFSVPSLAHTAPLGRTTTQAFGPDLLISGRLTPFVQNGRGLHIK